MWEFYVSMWEVALLRDAANPTHASIRVCRYEP